MGKKANETLPVEYLMSGNNAEPRIPYSLINNSETEVTTPTKEGEFSLLPPSETKTVIFCSGQVYYLLHRARQLNELRHVAIVRLEQVAPFPFWEVKDVIDSYPNLEEIVWTQEEHMNGGAWSYVEPRLETVVRETEWWKSGKGKAVEEAMDTKRVGGGLANLLFSKDKSSETMSYRGGRVIRFAGRDASAAPATGNKKRHIAEEQQLIAEAFFQGRLRKPDHVVSGVPVWKN